MLKGTWNWLQGKKTYIVSFGGLAYTWLQVWDGTVSEQTAIQATFVLLGIGAVRHGVSISSK
jgi:hypothetical protein